MRTCHDTSQVTATDFEILNKLRAQIRKPHLRA